MSLPSIAPIGVLWYAEMRARKRRKGAKWCARKGVGALRYEVEEIALNPGFAGLLTQRGGWTLGQSIEDARDGLKLVCSHCGDCNWSKR